MVKQLEMIMKRQLLEKNDFVKSYGIIDLKRATQYDPVDYFKRFMVN